MPDKIQQTSHNTKQKKADTKGHRQNDTIYMKKQQVNP